jgi:hypothetical protein
VKLSTLLAMFAYANEGLDELIQHHIPNLGVELLSQIRSVAQSMALVLNTVMLDHVVAN